MIRGAPARRGRRSLRLVVLLAVVLAGGCGRGLSHVPAAPGSSIEPPPETVLGFHDRADAFYQRLILRRFNALETFKEKFKKP